METKIHCPKCGSAAFIRILGQDKDLIKCECGLCNKKFLYVTARKEKTKNED